MSDAERQDPRDGRLLEEIYKDLRQRRDDGEIPKEYEAELDRAYAAVAPAAAVGGDGVVMIEMAAAKSSIHPHAPVDSPSRLGTIAKRLVRKATFSYISWFAETVADFAVTITRATQLVEQRVRGLEAAVLGRSARIDGALSGLSELPLPSGATEATVSRLAGHPGTIAAEDAREIVDALVRDRPSGSVRLGVAGSAPDSLDAVVLAGIVDRSTPDVAVALVQDATHALRPGALLLVVATDPSAPCSEEGVIARELSGGRPLSLATWRYLLSHCGFDEVAAEDLDGGFLVSGVLAP